jgi:hypothetical protein
MTENSEVDVPVEVSRPRGRPKGSTANRPGKKLLPVAKLSKWDNYNTPPMMDYRHEDIETLVGRQLSMVGLAQDRVRYEMLGLTEDGQPNKIAKRTIDVVDIERLNDLSMALVRSIDALQKCSKVAEELSRKLSPADQLRAAVDKIKAQDVPTLTEIISQLVKHRKRDPKHNKHAKTIAAANTIAALEDE